MKIKRKSTNILLGVVSLTMIAFGTMCYMSFVQLKNIDVAERFGSPLGNSTYDKILEFKTRILFYEHCWYIRKGMHIQIFLSKIWIASHIHIKEVYCLIGITV